MENENKEPESKKPELLLNFMKEFSTEIKTIEEINTDKIEGLYLMAALSIIYELTDCKTEEDAIAMVTVKLNKIRFAALKKTVDKF
jgi:hypothetical protein